MKLSHLDLFSGIGGFALGLESTGYFKTVAFCEIEEFPRRVLKKHWPDVACYGDVRDVVADRLGQGGIGAIDIVTGGFPCQDLSLAGARAGLSGERSGLWSELFRIIAEVRPRWAIIENVVGLRTLGADAVLADLAGAGYAAWPLVVGAVHAGAPHRRQRVWIVANAKNNGARWRQQQPECGEGEGSLADAADSDSHALRQEQGRAKSRWAGEVEPGIDGESWPAHPFCEEYSVCHKPNKCEDPNRCWLAKHPEYAPADSDIRGCAGQGLPVQPGEQGQTCADSSWSSRRREFSTAWDWSRAPEPVLRGMDDGLPCGMDRRKRIKALGNAVVPQIVAAIGRAIIEAEKCTKLTP